MSSSSSCCDDDFVSSSLLSRLGDDDPGVVSAVLDIGRKVGCSCVCVVCDCLVSGMVCEYLL